MTSVKKAVIPAAGLGTRFLPATKSMPKEMLPLIDRPTIQYVVEEAVNSGIEDIIIITGRSKRAIEDYFDDSPELEMHLEMNGKTDELNLIREISDIADIHYIRQKEPRGLGDAVLRAEKHIGDSPFAVLLGDDIVTNSQPCTRQLIDVYGRTGSSVIAIEEVPDEKVSSYGIIDGKSVEKSLYQIMDIVEKPSLCDAPSRLGAIGRYVFTPELFDCLKRTERGVGGEIQLTDAIRMLNGIQDVYAFSFSGKRYDTGDKIGYLKAIFDFAMADPEISESIREYMSKALKR
ncbi:UTP--glucose-1-phosphate uridylyltransferase GalU [Methanoplanus endosymbiosus]|uniref:UTP--glucose-1-phosphate uridylyltransferase n=1 Tax=Methanoplanus endosymbiosus TaxID=33865 RepID=A0A9E7PR80_9EURY|nr:UTP--glucose-1-phosphate uridylyltransferase GalU [Methanoplanus endosymbiosus]UUX93549.1 UTP--glucose-1-phosphate uridylyltransferase GalU [Methanoplanus endosymbiosus]